jgi:multiple sugar transport system substrate-binding protein
VSKRLVACSISSTAVRGFARAASIALVALALAAGAASCAGGNAASGDVSFLVFGEPEEIRAYRAVIRAFEQGEDDVHVKLIEASDRQDLLARLATSFAGGSPPDLFLVNYRFYGQFAARGVLEPLEERVEESNVFSEEDFFEQALDAFRWQGELTCLPQNISSLVVYYNRELFRRFQVPDPRTGWMWHEFVAAARALTRDARGNPTTGADPDLGPVTTARAEIYGVGVEPTIIRLAPLIWSAGGALVDDDEKPTRLMLDTPEAQLALGHFFALRTVYGVTPTDAEVEAEDDESRFANGRLGMLLSSRRSVPFLRASANFDWDVAALPILRKPAGILHSDAFCMAKASGRKEAAWRFVEYALGPVGQRILASSGRTVPSLEAVAESPAFLDPAKKPRNSRVFLAGIPTIRRLPVISTWPEIEDATEGIFENGMYLGTPVQQVAQQAIEATRPIFARAEP